MTAFFSKAGCSGYQYEESAKWRFAYKVLTDVQSKPQGSYRVARVIETLCDPQEYFGNREQHQEVVVKVNEVLSYYGVMADRQTGKLKVVPDINPALREKVPEEAKLFDGRNFHPEIRKHGRQLFTEGRHFHAVFECCKAFDRAVAEKAQFDKHGVRLMGAAFALTGVLQINTQRTESERNEQEGIMHLCTGLMGAIRNPESHEPELDWPMTQEDSLDALSLVSYLYRKLDKAVYYPGA